MTTSTAPSGSSNPASAAPVLDLNADLGEGFGPWRLGDDEALLATVTSANIACGFHAGDPATMRRVCRQAVTAGVAIGAHVGYRDLVGFGRRHLAVEPDDLAADVLYQLGALDAFTRAAGDRVRHVKPHGALYHAVTTDPVQAGAVVEAVRRFDPSLILVGAPGSVLLGLAEDAELPTAAEAFADRAMEPDGTLRSRLLPDAVLHDPETVARRCVEFARTGAFTAVDGTAVPVPARTLCLHGDTPGAADLARRVRAALAEAGVALRPLGHAAVSD
ncbi:5-oxoprolinase subunit PxpA [Kitasatospora cinereorecta]|uniref:5-oxoprolinase subunit A n=1 Tax=Kitasatospora cinereorecta TaxID=285560 RepID=A0ABW0VEZ4_9ACTN